MPPRVLQFGLRSLFGLAIAVAVIFGTLKWMGVGPRESLLVMLILIVGGLAAVGLVAAIVGSLRGD